MNDLQIQNKQALECLFLCFFFWPAVFMWASGRVN